MTQPTPDGVQETVSLLFILIQEPFAQFVNRTYIFLNVNYARLCKSVPESDIKRITMKAYDIRQYIIYHVPESLYFDIGSTSKLPNSRLKLLVN